MNAEQDVFRLQEVKRRVEMLISYFCENGNREAAIVQELEDRLRGVKDSLRMRTHAFPS